MEMSEMREAMPEAGRTVRHAQEHIDGGTPEPYAGGYAEGKPDGHVRPVSFAV